MTNMTNNKKVLKFVEDSAALACPDKIVWIDGSEAQRDALRAEYVAAVRESLTAHLENTYIVDEQGNKRKLKQKED